MVNQAEKCAEEGTQSEASEDVEDGQGKDPERQGIKNILVFFAGLQLLVFNVPAVVV